MIKTTSFLIAAMLTSAVSYAHPCGCEPTETNNHPLGRLSIISTTSAGEQGENHSLDASISANGEVVVFRSRSLNFTVGDGSRQYQIFAKNLVTGELTLVSKSIENEFSNKQNFLPVVSPDGTKVAFLSQATDLVDLPDIRHKQLYLADLITGEMRLVTKALDGGHGNHNTHEIPMFSPDGSKIIFSSQATNLVPDHQDGGTNLYIADVFSGEVMSITAHLEAQRGGKGFYEPIFVGTGMKVAFKSLDVEEVGAGSGPTRAQVILYDLITDSAEVVSTSTTGEWSEEIAEYASFSSDASKLVFISESENLGPPLPKPLEHTYLKDLSSGEVTLVTTSSISGPNRYKTASAVISPEGSRIAIAARTKNLVSNYNRSGDDIMLYDIASGDFDQVTVNYDGSQPSGTTAMGKFSFSQDGTKLVFESRNQNLVSVDTNRGDADIYLLELNPSDCVE